MDVWVEIKTQNLDFVYFYNLMQNINTNYEPYQSESFIFTVADFKNT